MTRLPSPPAWMLPAAVTVVILVLLLAYGSRPQAVWRVTEFKPGGGSRIGEVEPVVGLRFHSGRVVTGADATLNLKLGEALSLELGAGSRLVLPPAPGRWFGRTRRLAFSAGALRITATPLPAGGRLILHTAEAELELDAGRLVAGRDEASSRFEILTGSFSARVHGAEETLVLPAGRRLRAGGDGRHSVEPLTPPPSD